MASNLRPELSKKNKYWIPKNRFYELKYFCLQYPLWRNIYNSLDSTVLYSYDLLPGSSDPGDPIGKCVDLRSIYFDKMRTIEQTSIHADPYLASYILKAVTEGHSYTYLKSRLDIPCGRDLYYDRYRRFFWLLDKTRDNTNMTEDYYG